MSVDAYQSILVVAVFFGAIVQGFSGFAFPAFAGATLLQVRSPASAIPLDVNCSLLIQGYVMLRLRYSHRIGRGEWVMPAGDRRSSKLMIFDGSAAVAIAVAVAVLAHQPILDVPNTDREARILEPARVSPRCREADRATVAQLAAFLERNSPTDAPILERAIHTLNMTRRHCLCEWDGRGLEDYRWLSCWLSEHS
jgi:hypothetical protein